MPDMPNFRYGSLGSRMAALEVGQRLWLDPEGKNPHSVTRQPTAILSHYADFFADRSFNVRIYRAVGGAVEDPVLPLICVTRTR